MELRIGWSKVVIFSRQLTVDSRQSAVDSRQSAVGSRLFNSLWHHDTTYFTA
ncbi:MAG: hypothetical protein NTW10_00600 [Bacteroidetes bacterium]|nr:hypothetical protein [Bacteroidota bacterium]